MTGCLVIATFTVKLLGPELRGVPLDVLARLTVLAFG